MDQRRALVRGGMNVKGFKFTINNPEGRELNNIFNVFKDLNTSQDKGS